MTPAATTLRLRRESTLRSRAARGDATAFAVVYERHHQALFRYCRSILRHEQDAQDALQSTIDGDGRVLRGGRTRADLRSCVSSRSFQQPLTQRPHELAALVPPLPAAASAALLQQLL